MFDRITASYSLGLAPQGLVVKGAQLVLSKGQLVIERLFEIPLEGSKDVKQLDSKALVDLCQTVSGVSTASTLVRSLEIKLTKDKDIEAVLAFQAEPLLPYPPDQAILDSVKTSQTKDTTYLTLLAVRKDQLKAHLEQLRAVQIEPELISSTPVALALFSQRFGPKTASDQPLFVLNIDRQETTCVLASKGKLLSSHSFPQGVLSLAQAFAKDKSLSLSEALNQLPSVNFSQVSVEAHPTLLQACESLCLEMAKTLFASAKQHKIQTNAEILLTGEGSKLLHFSEILSKALRHPIAEPVAEGGPSVAEIQEYAIPIGLALSALSPDQKQVNFRQHEFAYPNPWKRFKLSLTIYFALCALVTLLLYLFGQAWLGYKQDTLRENYVSLLADMNKPYDVYEKDFYSKQHKREQLEGTVTLPNELSQEDLYVRLEALHDEISSTPDVFPLLPNTPRVSDVLAWLATHPHVVLQPAKGEESTTAIQIESFSYIMVKRPEQSKKQEKYQIKIELEFTSPTPKLAREFHDALMAPNDFVDPKGEIKWNSSKDQYRTSFFLKDKTFYPSSIGEL